LEQRAEVLSSVATVVKEKKGSNAAEQRQLKKGLTRVERQMEKNDLAVATLIAEQETAAFDAERLISIASELKVLEEEKIKLEEEWLQVTLSLDS
jgi:ATP-binding cassette subfamily F protein uup